MASASMTAAFCMTSVQPLTARTVQVRNVSNQSVGRLVVSARGAGAFRPSSRPKPTRMVKGCPQMEGHRDDAPAMNEDIRYDWNINLLPGRVQLIDSKQFKRGFSLPRRPAEGLPRLDPVKGPVSSLFHSPSICFSVCFTLLKH